MTGYYRFLYYYHWVLWTTLEIAVLSLFVGFSVLVGPKDLTALLSVQAPIYQALEMGIFGLLAVFFWILSGRIGRIAVISRRLHHDSWIPRDFGNQKLYLTNRIESDELDRRQRNTRSRMECLHGFERLCHLGRRFALAGIAVMAAITVLRFVKGVGLPDFAENLWLFATGSFGVMGAHVFVSLVGLTDFRVMSLWGDSGKWQKQYGPWWRFRTRPGDS